MTCHTRKGLQKRIVEIVLLVCALAALGAHGIGWDAAQAQTVPSPPPSVLNDIAATSTSPGTTDVTLTFGPKAPGFSLIGDDTDHPAIAFGLSSRGSSARYQKPQGLLHAVDFEQNDTVLILHLSVGRAVHMSASQVDDRTIRLTLAQAIPAVDAGGGASPSSGLPKSLEPAPGEDGFEVVFLKYADVSEVVGLLTDGLSVKSNDTFTPEEPNFGSVGTTNGASFSAPASTAQASGDSLAQSVDDAIAIDRRLNAIILKGSPEHIAHLKERIAQIDVPVESVLLETIFVELDESGAKNVGLNFTNTNNQIGVATFQTGAFIPAGEPQNVPLTSVSLQAALYAQVQAGHGKIVSRPRIAAQSGSTAKIVTGDALPILTSIALSGVNAVSQQVQYVNVGVTLQIAPRVSDDGYVTSHVFCVVSSVTGTSQGYPTISQREADTSATVRDGDTFVIGGLTEDSDIASDNKVPIVGDVPGLGQLFRQKTDTKAKTELYIFVTPRVLTHTAAEAILNATPPAVLKP